MLELVVTATDVSSTYVIPVETSYLTAELSKYIPGIEMTGNTSSRYIPGVEMTGNTSSLIDFVPCDLVHVCADVVHPSLSITTSFCLHMDTSVSQLCNMGQNIEYITYQICHTILACCFCISRGTGMEELYYSKLSTSLTLFCLY